MPPEMFNSKDSARSGDVYQLGLLLFEMLTGKPNVEGDNVQRLVRSIVGEPRRRLRDVDSEQDERPDVLIAQCLEQKPRLRPQTAGELVDLVSRIRRGQILEPYPKIRREPLVKSPSLVRDSSRGGACDFLARARSSHSRRLPVLWHSHGYPT